MGKVLRIYNTPANDLQIAVDGFLAVCKAKNLSSRTTEYYAYRLKAFAAYLAANKLKVGPSEVTPQIIRTFLTNETERASATTAHHSLLTLKVFFNHLVKDGFIDNNPAIDVDKPRRKKTLIQTLSPEQIQALLATCGKDYYGQRDRAMILTMLDTGIRVQELLSLESDDVSLEQQLMLVLGKGNKERQLPFGSGVRSALAVYLARRGDTGNNWLFVNHYGERMCRFSIRDMLQKRGETASIAGVRLSPHTLRHTFAKQWLLNGGDAFSLQRMLGHTTMDMVKNYVNLVASEVQQIHRSCSPVDRMAPFATSTRKRIR